MPPIDVPSFVHGNQGSHEQVAGPRDTNSGFTLIELLTSLTLFCVLGLMSYYGFSHYLMHQKQMQVISTTFHALQYAKQEAIHQRQIIRVGPRTNHCSKTWKDGLSVMRLDPSDKNKRLIFRQIDQTISWHSNQPCGFSFMPDGRCSTPGTLRLLGQNNQTTQIVINDSGRVRILLAES